MKLKYIPCSPNAKQYLCCGHTCVRSFPGFCVISRRNSTFFVFFSTSNDRLEQKHIIKKKKSNLTKTKILTSKIRIMF